MKMISKLSTTEEVNAMVKAIAEMPYTTVERENDAGTIVVMVKGAKRTSEVFRAIQKGVSDAWIVRHPAQLFV